MATDLRNQPVFSKTVSELDQAASLVSTDSILVDQGGTLRKGKLADILSEVLTDAELDAHVQASNPHGLTASSIGALTSGQVNSAINSATGTVQTNLDTHIGDTNPHGLTASALNVYLKPEVNSLIAGLASSADLAQEVADRNAAITAVFDDPQTFTDDVTFTGITTVGALNFTEPFTLTEVVLGTTYVRTVNNARLATTAFARNLISQPDETIEITSFSNGTTVAHAHTLGVRPSQVRVELHCLVAVIGYVAGDIIDYPANFPHFHIYSNNNTQISLGITCIADASNVRFAIMSSGIGLQDLTTHALNTNAVDDTNWKIVLKLWE